MAPTYCTDNLKVYVSARQLTPPADQTFLTVHVPDRILKSSSSSFYKLWNNLPHKIGEASAIEIFKSLLKRHFFFS